MPSTARLLPLAALLAVLLHAASSQANDGLLPAISFKPPFNTYDASGGRQIPGYTFGGNVVVNENFIRLTPDRASKRGWVWSKSPVDLEQWSATLRFRVSGQGKRLFGDGFAFWFTQERFMGDNQMVHGIPESFVGFGVVFDTFRNTESQRQHRDVSIVAQNLHEDLYFGATQGCDGDFRYWEGRDDFSIANKSVARISFNKDKVTVALDAKGKGDFSTCVQSLNIPLPANWHKTAYIGITASTGQLADNHDLLALLISANPDTVASETTAEDLFFSTGNPQLDSNIKGTVASASKSLVDKLEHLNHHVEHQLSAIQDTLMNNIKRLQEHEKAAETRIIEVENRLNKRLEDSLPDHVGSTLEANLNARLEQIEQVMKANLDLKMAEKVLPLVGEVQARTQNVGRSWVIPFLILFAAVGGAAYFAYTKYRKLLKSNLL